MKDPNSAANMVPSPPSSNRKTQRTTDPFSSKNLLRNKSDTRTINVINSMRKTNIQFPWGYRKTQNANKQYGTTAGNNPYYNKDTMKKGPVLHTIQAIEEQQPLLPLQIQMKEAYSTKSQAHMMNSQASTTQQQSIRTLTKHYGSQIGRNKTSYMDKRQLK